MNRRTILANLRANLSWAQDQRGAKRAQRTPEQLDRATNTVVGCCQCMIQGMQSTSAWMARRADRRRALKNIRQRYTSQEGNLALRQLLALTISAVEAATWMDDYWVGALPTPKRQQRSTPRTRAAAARATAASVAKARAEKERFDDMRKRRLGEGRSNHTRGA